MSVNFAQDMFTEAMSNVDITAVVVMMAIGFCIKHFSLLNKIQNDFIPPILFVIAFVYEFVKIGVSLPSVVTAIISAAVAIGLHTGGKNIFTVTILPKLIDMFKGMSYSGSTDPPEDKDGGTDNTI